MTLKQMETELKDLELEMGGKLFPKSAIQTNRRQRVAVIVPYRDRKRNLNIFLLYMHRFLSSQNIHYGIYLIEPVKDLKFNRALLLNIGFIESLKDFSEWDCFIFHDVDMLPENVQNIYQCDLNQPKQMAISLNTFFYTYNIKSFPLCASDVTIMR